uniref:Uncharacterized protein n=1 Tax=Caenorhabditis japonica TaxID=281687 RepID=A0A8R1EA91_CAEJA
VRVHDTVSPLAYAFGSTKTIRHAPLKRLKFHPEIY